MQNIAFRVPGTTLHRLIYPNGSLVIMDKPSSSAIVTRTQSGFTGARPKVKPYPIHQYDLDIQDFAFSTLQSYVFKNDGREERTEGPALSSVLIGAVLLPLPDYSSLYNEAVEKLNTSARGDLDLSIDVAEHAQVRRMLNYQQKVIDYTSTYLKRFGRIKTAANAWLEYTYGVKPLMSSCFGVADEMIRNVLNKTERHSVRSSGPYAPERVKIYCYDNSYRELPIAKSKMKISVTLGCNLRTPSSNFDITRWTSLNPVSIAWELLPYSFVVDWFVNVGGYLRGLETALLYASRFNSGYRTNLIVGTANVDFKVAVTTSFNSGFTKYVGQVRSCGIHRSVLTSYPAPTLPSFGVKLGSSRLLSGAALLAQMLGRR